MSHWVGIDVSKDTLDCGWFTGNQKHHIKVENTESGYGKILKETPASSQYVMEATGSYYLNAALYFNSHKKYVSVENPLRIKNHIKSNLKRSKSDKSDAFSIENFGRVQQPLPWTPVSRETAELQQLHGLRDKLVIQVGQFLINYMQSLSLY